MCVCVCVCVQRGVLSWQTESATSDKLFRVARKVCVCLGGNNIVSCFFQQKWVYIISWTVGHFVSRADLQTCNAITQNMLT